MIPVCGSNPRLRGGFLEIPEHAVEYARILPSGSTHPIVPLATYAADDRWASRVASWQRIDHAHVGVWFEDLRVRGKAIDVTLRV